jgi:hypothetical protein
LPVAAVAELRQVAEQMLLAGAMMDPSDIASDIGDQGMNWTCPLFKPFLNRKLRFFHLKESWYILPARLEAVTASASIDRGLAR